MTYEKFLETIRKEVQKRADSDWCVYLQDFIKNNDVVYNGLTIMDSNFNLAPTIYLNNFYDRYGDDIDSAVEEVLRIYNENKPDSKYDMSFFKVWESVKDKIAYKIVNTEWNSNLLRDVPHISFLDLSVVFYMILEHDDEGNATVLLHNEHLKAYWKCMILTKQLKIILMQQIRKISLRSTGLETYMQIRRTKNNMIWIKH